MSECFPQAWYENDDPQGTVDQAASPLRDLPIKDPTMGNPNRSSKHRPYRSPFAWWRKRNGKPSINASAVQQRESGFVCRLRPMQRQGGFQ